MVCMVNIRDFRVFFGGRQVSGTFYKNFLCGVAVLSVVTLSCDAVFAQSSYSDRLRAAIMDTDDAPALPASALPTNSGDQNGDLGPFGSVRPDPFGLDSAATSSVSESEPQAPESGTTQQRGNRIRQESFNAAITGLLPLQPDEIRELLRQFDKTQQAVELPVYPYPEPEIVVHTLSLDPGTKPPVIKVGVGHVTTLSILDVTGEPWPVQDLSFAGNFEVLSPEVGGNVIRITGTSEFAYGNMSLRLVELNTPVTFTIRTARDSVHYRFDARIPEFGPQADTPLIEGGVSLVSGNTILSSILDGVPPQGAERLNVGGADGRTSAYAYQNMTYVRTPLTLLSPGWSSSVSSADGMNVYALENAPVLLLSDRGQLVRARLNEEGSSYE